MTAWPGAARRGLAGRGQYLTHTGAAVSGPHAQSETLMTADRRKCGRCHTVKPASEFYASVPYRCKACEAERKRAWRATHRETHCRYQREWYARNRVRKAAQVRRWRETHPDQRRRQIQVETIRARERRNPLLALLRHEISRTQPWLTREDLDSADESAPKWMRGRTGRVRPEGRGPDK